MWKKSCKSGYQYPNDKFNNTASNNLGNNRENRNNGGGSWSWIYYFGLAIVAITILAVIANMSKFSLSNRDPVIKVPQKDSQITKQDKQIDKFIILPGQAYLLKASSRFAIAVNLYSSAESHPQADTCLSEYLKAQDYVQQTLNIISSIEALELTKVNNTVLKDKDELKAAAVNLSVTLANKIETLQDKNKDANKQEDNLTDDNVVLI